MQFAILGLLIIVVIGFFVVVWKASPNWRWYQIVAVSMTMLLAVIFIYPVAGALRSRAAWHKLHADLETRLERAQAEQERLEYGMPSGEAGVIPLAQELSQLGVEAGRHWRHLRVLNNSLQGPASGTLTLVLPPQNAGAEGVPPEPPAAEPDEDAPPPPPLVPEGMVVYGFAEQPQPNVEVPIPTVFLGEYRVTASSPNQVTLTPTGPLQPPQFNAINNRQAVSWSLYELLPLDGHQPFVAEGSVPDDDHLFGRIDEELVRRLMGQRVSPETLTSYLRDGTRATPDDPVISLWMKIEFTKKYSVTVDSPDQRGALDGGYFDASGRAVDSRLQQGEEGEVTFNPGDQIVVKAEAADELLDAGVAEPLGTYYVRPLNDYRFVLRRIPLRLTELAIRKTELEFEQDVLKEAHAAVVNMQTTNQEAKLKLEQDLQQTQAETQAVQAYNQNLQQQLQQLREKLVRLYHSNQQLENELDQLHRAVEQRVETLTMAQ